MNFLSKKQVRAKITLSPTQIGRLESEGKFPKRMRLWIGRYSRVAWIESELEACGLPPEKWSSLKYGLWPDGGSKNGKEETHG